MFLYVHHKYEYAIFSLSVNSKYFLISLVFFFLDPLSIQNSMQNMCSFQYFCDSLFLSGQSRMISIILYFIFTWSFLVNSHVQLKRIFILLSYGRVMCMYQLGQIDVFYSFFLFYKHFSISRRKLLKSLNTFYTFFYFFFSFNFCIFNFFISSI